jgi:uncharacterized protein (DUF1015 family)
MTAFGNDLVRPFAALRPAPGRAADIAAPPYDVMNADEARELAEGRPFSFLHVSRAEIDLAPDTDPYAPEVYQTAGRNLKAFEASGALIRDPAPCYYVYRMTTHGRSQTGVALSASVDAYVQNRIRKHELTRPAKEDDRVRQIEAVDAITGPVLLVHRADAALADLLTAAAGRDPDLLVADLDGVRHEVWAVGDAAANDAIGARLNAMGALYIADGHHRSAAAARVAEARRAKSGPGAHDGFLAVSFPDDEMKILDYNRVVRDLNGRSAAEFVHALDETFHVRPSDIPVRPSETHSYGMYLDGKWSLLTPHEPVTEADPVERLDVRVLDRLLLAPLLGIQDPRTDARIDFIGGSRGVDGVAARVDSGEMAVGFTLFPTSLADLMAVADAGQIMPPKSTWFDPKLADGLLSLPLD